MRLRPDAVAWVGFGLGIAGIVWLGPLMLDQMTFFADRDQEADAAAARSLMPLPALLIAAGAALLTWRVGPLLGTVAALPLVAIALAWLTPDALYQLLAYGLLAAPAAFGAYLAACLPIHWAPGRPVVTFIALVLLAAIVATPVLGGIAAVGLATWWRLSRSGRDAALASAID